MKPLYIAIEGGEGSGKSSLVAALKAELGDSILVTREPGGSPDGAVIRHLLLTHPLAAHTTSETELYLMFADRYDNIEKTVMPALEKGIPVVTDRSDGSSYAYQVAAGDNRAKLEHAFSVLRKKLPRLPDLYVFIDIAPEIGLQRRRRAGDENHIDKRPLEFHRRVRQGFADFRDMHARQSVVIDANRPFEEVKADFLTLMRKELSRF